MQSVCTSCHYTEGRVVPDMYMNTYCMFWFVQQAAMRNSRKQWLGTKTWEIMNISSQKWKGNELSLFVLHQSLEGDQHYPFNREHYEDKFQDLFAT